MRLNAQTTDSCHENYDVVGSGAGFGVTWVHGCISNGPTLNFTKVMPAGDGFSGVFRFHPAVPNPLNR